MQQTPVQANPPVKVTLENQPISVVVKEKNTRKISLGLILGWILGLYAISWGFYNIFQYQLMGSIILFSGIIVFPPISNVLKTKLKIELSGPLKWFTYFILQTIGFFLMLGEMAKALVHQ